MPALNFDFDSKRLCELIFIGLLILLIPLKISLYGWLPPDDAMRHAAFATTDRAWGDVLLLRDTIRPSVDSHPLWHRILHLVHKNFGFSTDELVVVSYIFTFSLFNLVWMSQCQRPIMWPILALVIYFVEGYFPGRILLGRPFALSITCALYILYIMQKSPRLSSLAEYALIMPALTIAIACHPSWYLWLLVSAAFAASNRWRDAWRFTLALILSLLLATAVTGSFYNIVLYPIHHLLISLNQDPIRKIYLVTEFQPNLGAFFTVALVSATLAYLALAKKNWRTVCARPDFALMTIGWLFGLLVSRFWWDWGCVGLISWLTYLLSQCDLDKIIPKGKRWFIYPFPAIAVFAITTADLAGRYTANLTNPVLTKPAAEVRPALPEPGGILYDIDMGFFYQTFYRFPQGGFKYSIGFEPGMMPIDDLMVMRKIQFNDGAIAAYDEWFKKMTELDRIVIPGPSKPEKDGFAFELYFGRWVGKKIQANSSSIGDPSAASGAK